MLVTKNKYDEGDVVAFKLINGDEVVAKVKEQTDAEFVLNKPCTVLPSAKGIGLVQSLFTAGDGVEVRIQRSHVIMHAPVVKEVQNHYIQVTTGIQPVTSGSIVV